MNRRQEPVLHLESALMDLWSWFRASDTKALVIGGVAASLLGVARTTRDVDALVFLNTDLLNDFVKTGKRYGFQPRIENAVLFAKTRRVLLLQHTPSRIDIDISLGALPFEAEAIARGLTVHLGKCTIRIPTPEDLIIMKAVAHRLIDLGDVERVFAMHPNINVRRIRFWVREFAKALQMPEILNDLGKLLKAVPKKSRRKKKKTKTQ